MGPLILVLWLVLTFGAFYLLLIRPQRRQLAAHAELVESLEVGDEVVLTSGILGQIVAEDPDDDLFTVQIAPGVHIGVMRSAVGRRMVIPAETDGDEIDVTQEPEPGSND